MATLKLTIDKRRTYNDARLPVIFRLTAKGKSTSIDANIKLFSTEWDNLKGIVNKTHPNHKNINLQLKQRHYELEKKLLEITSQQGELNVVDLKNALLGKDKKDMTFYEFATREIQTLKDQQRFGNANVYETAVNRLVKFTGKNITLDKINYRLIIDFDAHLIKEGLSKNSVAVYMREIRALLNKAIKRSCWTKTNIPLAVI